MGAGGRGFCCPRKESAQVAGDAGSRQAAIFSTWPTLGWYTTYGGKKHGLGAPKMTPSWGHRRSPGTLPWSFRPVLPGWLWAEPTPLLGASPHLLYCGPHRETVPRVAIKRTFALCPSHHCSFSPVQKRANSDGKDALSESATPRLRSEGQFRD